MSDLMFGEMLVGGEPPAKLVKALAVIASDLHPAFDRETWGIAPGQSKRSCVLASLAVRDFLWRVGFKEAQVAPVYFFIRAFRGDEEVHSLGVGDHSAIGQTPHYAETDSRWNGHMAVKVGDWLIDVTLYQCQRPQWDGLPGMAATPMVRGLKPLRGHTVLAGGEAETGGVRVEMIWLDQPENRRWRTGDGDTLKERRANVVRQLVRRFRG